jgi:spoIIIJ-associated protein
MTDNHDEIKRDDLADDEPGTDPASETSAEQPQAPADGAPVSDLAAEGGPVEGEPPEVSPETIAAQACEVAKKILSYFPKIQDPVVTWKIEHESIWVEIEGDPSGRLIGRRGLTIDAFQHVVSKIISHQFRKKLTINVDAEQYKKRHREKLEKLALQTADYVAKTKEPRALEPMSPADRRFVHIALKGRTDILTASEGREPSRFVVIWPNTDEE